MLISVLFFYKIFNIDLGLIFSGVSCAQEMKILFQWKLLKLAVEDVTVVNMRIFSTIYKISLNLTTRLLI